MDVKSFWWKLAAVIVVVALAVAGLEFYTRQPVLRPVPALALPADTRLLVLVIHGSGDVGSSLLADITAGLEARHREFPGAAVRFLRWDPESDQRLRAAATAQALGEQLGALLANSGKLQELQLIAHSSGTFMPDAICTSFRRERAVPVRVSMVLLDPFQIRGFVDWSWGAREHGRCADFALAVINTDDPAPATNRAIDNAFNLDVTQHPGRAAFTRNGHYWPVQYYLDYLLQDQPEIGAWSHDERRRGVVRRMTVQSPHTVR